ncbi:MAG: 7-cyano-7-deazaguanine synthase QueC [Pyrinomonadaceae bacterium]|nr:7-cyano-7-deazaguanine synthase QueC [Phycisphaerales bacterium]
MSRPDPSPRSTLTGACVVLLSGGLDSATALAIARQRHTLCHALSIDYGQRHRVELDAAQRVAASIGVAGHVVVPMDLRGIGGSALTSDTAVPKDRSEHDLSHGQDGCGGAIPITYVPARNMVFLSLAMGFAEVVKARDVYIGVNQLDYSGYPDCREEFIRAFEHAAQLGTKAGTEDEQAIRIQSPLVHMTKAEIIRLGTSLGVDFSLTISCYDPVVRSGHPASQALACGRCDACQLRRRGFQDAGVADPTQYVK